MDKREGGAEHSRGRARERDSLSQGDVIASARAEPLFLKRARPRQLSFDQTGWLRFCWALMLMTLARRRINILFGELVTHFA